MDSWLERNSLTLFHSTYIKTMYHYKIKHIDQFRGVELIRSSVEIKHDLVDQTQFIFKENFTKSHLAIPIQRHTDNVEWVDKPGIYENVDGLVSNLKNKIHLSISVADCVPVCLFDSKTKNFALVHSGWRGTYKKITNKAVLLMVENGSIPKDILVYCGVSISKKNYEVGRDVAGLFSRSNVSTFGKKFLLDIKSQIRDDLIEIELLEKNISIEKDCTYSNTTLPSFRRDGDQAGRITFFMGKND